MQMSLKELLWVMETKSKQILLINLENLELKDETDSWNVKLFGIIN